ncbi:MAG: tRNA (adenosine(37)-N6)-dimethylallyltransferase MiaA [Aquificae bacterium]|nr:tRNA (adenosine(37)-N6)-dimethylallyltransferase MiaA [Aquificota bacterium]
MRLIVITGTTATGKTEIGIELAKLLNGEVISADAMMVYKGMDIGTAKPKPEEMEGIPHHLIDVVEPSENFSVKEFITLADRQIERIRQKGKTPIVVGGTWLYIQALLYGLTDAPPSDWRIRESLYREEPDRLYRELLRVDREYGEKIHPNDLKRIVRALEVYRLTGKPFSHFQKKHGFREKRYDFTGFVFEMDRERLMDRIEKRVEKMFQEGLVDEVKKLIDTGYENALTSKQAIGYKELIPYIKGEINLQEAKGRIIKNTKDFAKRQLRTFRSKLSGRENWHFIKADNYTKRSVLDTIIKKLNMEEKNEHTG